MQYIDKEITYSQVLSPWDVNFFFKVSLGLSKKRPLLEASPISENLFFAFSVENARIFSKMHENAHIFGKCVKMRAFSENAWIWKMRAFSKDPYPEDNFLVLSCFYVLFTVTLFSLVNKYLNFLIIPKF